MKQSCDYCGNYLSDTDEVCPHCGAPNPGLKRAGAGVPATIEELRAFCEKHNMPLERMRFFIGEDCREARAFGIYRDEEGLFVVYKNKSDGSRAVRYRGKDEAYAVNELYQKLQSEILNQKQHRAADAERETRSAAPAGWAAKQRKKKNQNKAKLVFWGIVGIFILASILTSLLSHDPTTGYYSYGGDHYYSQYGEWYSFDNALGSWVRTEADDFLSEHYSDYYDSDTYEYGSDYSDWSDSEYAPSHGGSDSDDWDSDWDDSDWDYDYDDWDSGYSDWDSDW